MRNPAGIISLWILTRVSRAQDDCLTSAALRLPQDDVKTGKPVNPLLLYDKKLGNTINSGIPADRTAGQTQSAEFKHPGVSF